MISSEKPKGIQGLSRPAFKAQKSMTSRNKRLVGGVFLTLSTLMLILALLATTLAWLQLPMGFKPQVLHSLSQPSGA
jgi:hypothetical protein